MRKGMTYLIFFDMPQIMLSHPIHIWLMVYIMSQDCVGGQDYISRGQIKSTDKLFAPALTLIIYNFEGPYR